MPITEVCRLCLHQAITACSLLQNNSNKMLESLTSIKVDSSNEFSTISCVKCYHDLKLAYKIQQKFLRINEKLKDILQRNTMKKEVEGTIKCEEIILNEEGEDPLCISNDENNSNQEKEQLNENYQCIYYDKMFTSKKEYTEHVSSHSQTVLYSQKKEKLLKDNEKLKVILQRNMEKAVVETVECEEIVSSQENDDPLFISSDESNSNQEKEQWNESDQCIYCDKMFSSKAKYTEHVSSHSQTILCSQLKKEDMLLISEKTNDNNKKQVQFEELDVEIKGLSSGHSRKHPMGKRKPCPICKKEITAYNLSKHIKIHDDEPKICEACGKTYANVESLRRHMFRIHRGKIYECEQCNVTFKSRQSFNIHRKKQHIGSPSYVCETCGKRFFFGFDLKKHIERTHLKIRPYICDFCRRGFSSLHAMKTHRRQHTNETPYRCEECGDGFRQNVSLKAHKKSKHNIVETITSECKVCGKGFASEHAVKAHMRLH